MLKKLSSTIGPHLRMPWWLFWGLLLSITWFYIVRRVISWDLWWHMAAGQYLMENGVVGYMFNPMTWIYGGPYLLENGVYPDATTFTFSEVKGASFISKTWLGDIIFHLSYVAGSFYGLQILRGTFMLVPVFLTLHLVKWRYNIWTLLGCSLLLVGTMQKHLIKNAIVVLPLMSYIAWAWIQIRFKHKWKLLFTFPFVFSFWSHFHGSAIVGINFLFMILVGDVVDSIILPALGKINRKNVQTAFADMKVVATSAIGIVVLYACEWWFSLGLCGLMAVLCQFEKQTQPFFDMVKERSQPKITLAFTITFFICSFVVGQVWGSPMSMIEKSFSKGASLILRSSDIEETSNVSATKAKPVKPKSVKAQLKERLRFIFSGTDADMVAEYQWPFDIPYVLSVKAVFVLILLYFVYLRLRVLVGWHHTFFSMEIPCLALIILSLGYLRTVSYSFLAVVPFMAYGLQHGFSDIPKKHQRWLGALLIIESLLLIIIHSKHPIFHSFYEEYFKVLGYAQWIAIPFLFIAPACGCFLLARDAKPEIRKQMGLGILGLTILSSFAFDLRFDDQLFSANPKTFTLAILFCPTLVGFLFLLPSEDFFKRSIKGLALGLGLYTLACMIPFIHYENSTYQQGDFHNVSGFLDTEPGLGKSNKFFDGMADYVLEKLPKDKNIYNTYNMGGYLQWKWYGERKVFIDGRSIIFDNNFYQAYTKNNAQAYIKKHDFDHAIINMLVDKDRLKVLYQQGWTPLAFDPGMTVLERPKNQIEDVFGLLPAFQEGERSIAEMENLDRQALGNFFMETLNHMMFFGRIKDGKDFMTASLPIIEQLGSNERDPRGQQLVQQLKSRLKHVSNVVNIFGNINHRAIGPMCRKILVDQVKGVEMHLAQGETHFALEQWAKAEPHLIRAYTDLKKDKKKNPSLKLLSMIGHLLYEQKKIDRSLAAYQEAINAHPNHAGIHNAVMLPLMAKKDFDKAIQVGQKAIQLDRGMVDAYYNLASAWIGKGDSDKASQILSAALQINPNFQKAKTLLKKIQGS